MGFASGNHFFFGVVFILLYFGVAWYIVRDARRRGQSGVVWGLVALFLSPPLGWALWFIVRRGIPIRAARAGG